MSIIASLIDRVTALGLIQYFWGNPGTQEALTANYDTLDSLITQDRARLGVLELGGTLTNWEPSQFELIASDRLAAAGDWLFVDATALPRTVTLPAAPSVLDAPIIVSDAGASWAVNTLTIARNGELIEGAASDFVVDVGQATLIIAFAGGATGWRVISYEKSLESGLRGVSDFRNEAGDVVFQIHRDVATGRVNVTGGWNLEARGGGMLVARDASDVDQVRLRHDGVDAYLEGTNISRLIIRPDTAFLQPAIVIHARQSVADEATATFSLTRNRGTVLIVPSTNRSRTAVFAFGSTSITDMASLTNVSLGLAGVNPDVAGRMNVWISDAGLTLNLKNRSGVTDSYSVYHMTG